jgi:hypothetical protein
MIDSVLNLLFRCPHKRLTRPVTPISMDGKPHGDTYVVCLACGKQFAYDLKEMRIGKPLPSSAAYRCAATRNARSAQVKDQVGAGNSRATQHRDRVRTIIQAQTRGQTTGRRREQAGQA